MKIFIFLLGMAVCGAQAAELRLLPIQSQGSEVIKTQNTPEGLQVTVSTWVPCQASYKGLLLERAQTNEGKIQIQVRSVGEYLGDVTCVLPGFYLEESTMISLSPKETADFVLVQPVEGTWPHFEP